MGAATFFTRFTRTQQEMNQPPGVFNVQQPAGLPPGWIMYLDSTGRPFYWNQNTQESSWNPPVVATPPPIAVSRNLPAGWEEARDSSGKLYYIDHNTATTHWQPPATSSNSAPQPHLLSPRSGNSKRSSWGSQQSVPVSAPFRIPTSLANEAALFASGSVDAASCEICNVDFGKVLNRRHHCRCCMRSFCDAHSKRLQRIPHFGHTSPVRVCDACANHLSHNDTTCLSRLVPYLDERLVPPGVEAVPLQVRALEEMCTVIPAARSGGYLESKFEAHVLHAIIEHIILANNGDFNDITTTELVLKAMKVLNVCATNVDVVSEVGSQRLFSALGEMLRIRSLQASLRKEIVQFLALCGEVEQWRFYIFSDSLELISLLNMSFDESDANSQSTMEWILLAVRNLCRTPTICGSLAESLVVREAIPAYVTQLSSRNPNVVRNAAGLLELLTVVDAIHEAVFECGGVQMLVELLIRNEDAEAERSALLCIDHLSHYPPACSVIVSSNGVAVLSEMLPMADAAVQLPVLQTLQRLLDNDECSLQVGQALLFGSLSSLVESLTSQSMEVQAIVLRILRLLVIFDAEGKDLVGQSNAISYLVSVYLARNVNSSEALNTLTFLVTDHAQNSARMIESGGLSAVTQVLSSSDEDAQLEAANALSLLSSNPAMHAALQIPTIQTLVSMLSSDSLQLRIVTAKIMANLCEDSARRTHLYNLMVLPVLIMQLNSEQKEIQQPLLRVLALMASEADLRSAIAEAGALNVVVSILSVAVEPDIQEAVALAVLNLSRDYKIRDQFDALGAIPAIVGLASRTVSPMAKAHSAECILLYTNEGRHVRRANGVSVLVDILFCESSAARKHAVSALSNFRVLSRAEADKILQQGGVIALLGILGSTSTPTTYDTRDEITVQRAAQCLATLVEASPGCREAIMSQRDSLETLCRLVSSPSSSETCLRVVQLLAGMSDDSAFGVFLSASPALIKALVHLAITGEKELCNLAISTLVSACETCPEVWKVIVDTGGIDALVMLLGADDNRAQLLALDHALARVSDDSFRSQFVAIGGLAACSSLLSSPHRAVVYKSVLVLQALSRFESTWNSLCAQSTLGGIVALLAGNDAEMRVAACSLLANISNSPERATQFVRSEALQRVIAVVFSSDAREQTSAARFLANCARVQHNADAIHAAGGVVALITLLSSADLGIQASVTDALVSLSKDQNCLQDILDNDGMRPIAKLLKSTQMATKFQALKLVGLLSQNPNFCDAIENAGGLQSIVELLLLSSAPDAKVQALSALANIARRRETRVGLHEAGVLQPLLQCIVHAAQSAEKKAVANGTSLRDEEANDDAEAKKHGSGSSHLEAEGPSSNALLALSPNIPFAAPSAPPPPPSSSETGSSAEITPNGSFIGPRAANETVYRERPLPSDEKEMQRILLEKHLEVLSQMCVLVSVRNAVIENEQVLNALLFLFNEDSSDLSGALTKEHVSRILVNLSVDMNCRTMLVARGIIPVLVDQLYLTRRKPTILLIMRCLEFLAFSSEACKVMISAGDDVCAASIVVEFLAAAETEVQAQTLRTIKVLMSNGMTPAYLTEFDEAIPLLCEMVKSADIDVVLLSLDVLYTACLADSAFASLIAETLGSSLSKIPLASQVPFVKRRVKMLAGVLGF